ncbi:MAG: hypothetical protein ACYC3L_03825 [Gemmatimonadaceae bacterium]
MAHVMMDLESLAGRMGLPFGGIGIVLWGEEPPRLLVRAHGGLSMDHIPMREAFAEGHVECVVHSMKANITAVSLPSPRQDVVMDGTSVSGVEPSEVIAGTECTELEIKAKIHGAWEVIGARALNPSDEMARHLAQLCDKRHKVEVDLLQGSRPQFVAKCFASAPAEVVAHA